MMHFNVAFPLIGRAIAGLGDPFLSIATGELVRIYGEEESTSALWWFSSAFCFGSMTGPVMVLFFRNVDFYIGSIHITKLNASALVMAGLLLLAAFNAYFLIHDCSAEIDLKTYIAQEKLSNEKKEEEAFEEMEDVTTEDKCLLSTDEEEGENHTSIEHITIPAKVVLLSLLRHADAVLLFVSTFVFMNGMFAADVLLPLLTIDVLKWSLSVLTWLIVGSSLFFSLLVMIMSLYCTSEGSVYVMSIVCMLFNILMILSMLGIKVLQRNLQRDVCLMTCFITGYVFAWCIEVVIMRCMLAKMVPSHCQSFTESCRNGVAKVSTILASVTAPLLLPYLEWWCTGVLVVLVAILIVFLIRRKNFTDIKQIRFEKVKL